VVRRGAKLFRDLLLNGTDILITSVDGHLAIPRPAHLKGQAAKDWDAYVRWLEFQNEGFASASVLDAKAKEESESPIL